MAFLVLTVFSSQVITMMIKLLYKIPFICRYPGTYYSDTKGSNPVLVLNFMPDLSRACVRVSKQESYPISGCTGVPSSTMGLNWLGMFGAVTHSGSLCLCDLNLRNRLHFWTLSL